MKTFTRLIRTALLCLSFLAATSKGFSQQIEKSLVLSNKEKIGFLEYKPTNYSTEGNVKHPLIIFLHGIGERGNGTTDLHNVSRIGLPRMIRLGHKMTFTWNGKTETFLVISPQCRGTYGMWPELLINEIIDYAKQNLRIDTNRIYLTGLSMGGGGTYRFISRQQSQAAKVAAAATICAPCTFANGKNVADANLPVWSFHAANDTVALESCTETAIKRIIDANPAVMPLKTIWPDGGHPVWDRVYTDTNYRYNGVINIYEWFLGQNKALPVNKLPVANVGRDISIATGQTVTLDGSASTDADGKLVRYVWKKILGPASGKITTVMGPRASTTLTGITIAGVYKYELAVVDDRAGFTRDTLTVTVTAQAAQAPAPAIPNKIPVANAGRDTTIQLPQVLTLNGSATDADGKIVSYMWMKAAGGKVKLVKTSNNTVRLDSLEAGTYTFRLLVEDDKGGRASDIMKVTVLDNPYLSKSSSSKPNIAPVARTTGDQVIPVEWNYFPSVSGHPSTDADGWLSLFTWEKISGPDAFNIVSPRSCRTRINNLVPGVYVFRLTAYDNRGASSYSDLKITMTKNEQKSVQAKAASAAVIEEQVVKTEPVPLTHVTMPASLSLYPNPAINMANLQYTSDAIGGSVIRIYDATGKLIKSISFWKSESTYKHNLEISGLNRGIYYIEVRTGSAPAMQSKLVKQ
jgi:poly(3-hydroxybutyrate) depolymerase